MGKSKNKALLPSSVNSQKEISIFKDPVSSKAKTNLKSPVEFSYFREKPSWVFSKCDFEHCAWGFCQNKGASQIQRLLQFLKSFESMTWAEILQASKGNGKGSKSHVISIEKISKEAQARLDELNLYCEELMSLRVDGKERVWGYREGAKCAIIWHDSDHAICQSSKKHT